MTNEQLGTLLSAFAHYYWSVPVEYVANKICAWHPEVTKQQFLGVLKKANKELFWHHFCMLKDGLETPEIAAEHLVAVDPGDYDRFLAARIEGPYCDCEEETLLRMEEGLFYFDIPEVNAIKDFGRNELGLDEEWSVQLLDDCQLSQAEALCDGSSWVQSVLEMESYGKIHFQTVDQVKRLRDLGNKLYQVIPNPVLKGWRPVDLKNPPLPLDDIPEKDEEIPNSRPTMEKFRQSLGFPEDPEELWTKDAAIEKPKQKVGRNDPCPCGSGKKYKKCCGSHP